MNFQSTLMQPDEMPDLIDEIFQPVYGKPCWQVKQGIGSFLTFEFEALAHS
jgi:hypothetical protein